MPLNTRLAQAADPIGSINAPVNGMVNPINATTGQLEGMLPFFNSILRLLFISAGLFAFFNLLWAGFMFINAGGDAEYISKVWSKIYMSVIGLVVIVASFLFAAIIGMLMFGNPTALLNPNLGPRP